MMTRRRPERVSQTMRLAADAERSNLERIAARGDLREIADAVRRLNALVLQGELTKGLAKELRDVLRECSRNED